MRRRPLCRPIRQAIPLIIETRQGQTHRRLAGEEVIRVSEVLQPRQRANSRRNRPRQQVMSHIELLKAHHPSNCARQRTQELIVADVEHRQVLQHPNLLRQARPEPIVHQNNLVQVRHVAQASRNAAVELVVGQNDDGDRRVPEIIRQIEPEPVMVDENSIQVLVKQLPGHSPLELIEPQIQEFQLRKLKHNMRELTGESIVTDIELEKQLQVPELVRHSPTEPVGIDVEQCEICEQPKLLGQVASNIAVVEVNAGDGSDRAVVGSQSTEHSSVVADIRSDPIPGEIERVRENSLLPSLQCYVSISESLVFEDQRRVYFHELSPVTVLVPVVEQLALLDVEGLGVGETSMADNVAG